MRFYASAAQRRQNLATADRPWGFVPAHQQPKSFPAFSRGFALTRCAAKTGDASVCGALTKEIFSVVNHPPLPA